MVMLDRQNRELGKVAYSDRQSYLYVLSGLNYTMTTMWELEEIYSGSIYFEKSINAGVFLSAQIGDIGSEAGHNNSLYLIANIGDVEMYIYNISHSLSQAVIETSTNHDIIEFEKGTYNLTLNGILYQEEHESPTVSGTINNIRLSIVEV